MKTRNYIVVSTMALGALFFSSCQKDTVVKDINPTDPTYVLQDDPTGAVYQIEIDLSTALTIEKPDCPVDRNQSDISQITKCDGWLYAYGEVNGSSPTFGESTGNISLHYNSTNEFLSGTLVLTYENTDEELVISMKGSLVDITVAGENYMVIEANSTKLFAGMDFDGQVQIDNVREIFNLENSSMNTSILVSGELQ